jgi:hypothetical protein
MKDKILKCKYRENPADLPEQFRVFAHTTHAVSMAIIPHNARGEHGEFSP